MAEKTKFRTEQEQFWAGAFGDEYIARNFGPRAMATNISLFSRILSRTSQVKSVIECGANVGINLLAMHRLPDAELSAVEINGKAVRELRKMRDINVYHQSLLDFKTDRKRDLALTRGVLIHINPAHLVNAYGVIYRTSRRFICVAEYYSPKPVEVDYRGQKGRLFKRDFAGELLDIYKDVRLVDYGFTYHHDTNFPQDDLTWFLLEKRERMSHD